ncbi:MAG: arginase [Proteobacteria bacterium]|nr:arginase [Pseudomonadota bacterium]
MENVTFIGSASGWGAQVRETEKGPEYLQQSGVLNSLHVHWIWKETLFPSKTSQQISLPPGPLTLPYIEDICLRLSSSVAETLQSRQFPVVIGGDHVIAVGTWAGVIHQLKTKQNFGLIWIDAHMDAHTMETTPSKAFHGMPLAALLGFGEPSLVNVLENGPLLNPKHVCLIGVRSYEEGEENLLKRLGVHIYYMKEVQERGFESVFKEAVQLVKNGTRGYGISIDLDAFDPDEAPGVGTPAPQGLQAQKVLPFLKIVQGDTQLKALEIVEFNPDRDKDKKTLFLLRDVLKEILEKDRG